MQKNGACITTAGAATPDAQAATALRAHALIFCPKPVEAIVEASCAIHNVPKRTNGSAHDAEVRTA